MHLLSFVFDLTLPPLEYHQKVCEWNRLMREEQPIVFSEDYNSWIIFRYDDVIRVQEDYTTYSSKNIVKNKGASSESSSIIEMDPPEHRQKRSLLTRAFSARTIAAMAPQIARITKELLEQATTKEQIEWMAELANPLPIIVISEMLGLPREAWPQFKIWTDAIINKSPSFVEASSSFVEYFARAIEEHQRTPQQDILSLLINAEVDGAHITYQELLDFCFTLFIAGNITTTNMLGNMLLCLNQYPEAWKQLKQHPELVPSAVEEILRYMPPFRVGPNDILVGRIATTDVEICGQRVRKGEKIDINRLAANFDERQFPQAEHIDVARNPNRHQSFGHGIHFCIGAPLARLEMTTVLADMLQRFESFQISTDRPLQQAESKLIFGPKNLPITFQLA